ncbi:MAG: hypothetical protein ABL908_09570 [Hyphomicrobium sp.]
MPRISSSTAQVSPVRERPQVVRAAVHQTRDADIATEREIHVDSAPTVWREPTALDAPPPRPGMVQRWVRDLAVADSQDNNWARRYGEGWRPRDPSSVSGAFQYLTGKSSAGQPTLRVGNSVLCEMPVDLARQRAAHYRNKLERQMQTAGADLDGEAAAAGRKIGMRPIETSVEDVTPVRGRTPVMTD